MLSSQSTFGVHWRHTQTHNFVGQGTHQVFHYFAVLLYGFKKSLTVDWMDGQWLPFSRRGVVVVREQLGDNMNCRKVILCVKLILQNNNCSYTLHIEILSEGGLEKQRHKPTDHSEATAEKWRYTRI